MLWLPGSLYPAIDPILRLSVWLALLAVIFVPLERLFAANPQKIFRQGFATDLGYYFVNSLLPALLLSVPAGLLAWAVHRAVPSGFLAWTASLPIWARLIAGLIAADIGAYWGHRWSHEIPFLWRFHSIHHSAGEIDFLVNTRAHPIDMVFTRFCGLVPLYAIGFGGPSGPSGTVVPVLVTLIGTMWGFFIHANLRWRFGPLEWLVATPAFHHWHHTLSGPIDRNFAANLPWIDWIFGSFYLSKEWPSDYGIKARMPDSLIDQLVYPFLPPAPERIEQAVAAMADPEPRGPEHRPQLLDRVEELSTEVSTG